MLYDDVQDRYTRDDIIVIVKTRLAHNLMDWADGDWYTSRNSVTDVVYAAWNPELERGNESWAVINDRTKFWELTEYGLNWCIDCIPELLAEEYGDDFNKALYEYARSLGSARAPTMAELTQDGCRPD